MKSILQKEQTYKAQMVKVKALVVDFAEKINWSELGQGRKAHASIKGTINGFDCVIQIGMERLDWGDMPDFLTEATRFTLWCSGGKDINFIRKFINQELYWLTTFGQLEKVTPLFLEKAWEMLQKLDLKQELFDWYDPSSDPDIGPYFGGPRQRWKNMANPTQVILPH